MVLDTTRFIKKIVIRLAILSVILVTCIAFLNAGGTILSNQIALGQMENNDSMFILMEMYNNAIRPAVNWLVTISTIVTVGFTGYDIYKFIKTKKEVEKK